jgi:hypothetical protein
VYFFKVVRIYELKALSATISRLVGKCKEYKNAKKKFLSQLEYFITLTVVLACACHIIACMWLYFGLTIEGSWLQGSYATMHPQT